MSNVPVLTLVVLLLLSWTCVSSRPYHTEISREKKEGREMTPSYPTVRRRRLKRAALELSEVPQGKNKGLTQRSPEEAGKVEPKRESSRIKKQILFPVQWQYVLPGLNPGGSAPWLYYPVSTSTPDGWIQGSQTDQARVDSLYGGTASHRDEYDQRTDEEIVNDLYRKPSATNEPPCVSVPAGDISLTTRPCRPGEIPSGNLGDSTSYRGSYWLNKPVQGHYHTPQSRLASFGHVIIHDKNQ